MGGAQVGFPFQPALLDRQASRFNFQKHPQMAQLKKRIPAGFDGAETALFLEGDEPLAGEADQRLAQGA